MAQDDNDTVPLSGMTTKWALRVVRSISLPSISSPHTIPRGNGSPGACRLSTSTRLASTNHTATSMQPQAAWYAPTKCMPKRSLLMRTRVLLHNSCLWGQKLLTPGDFASPLSSRRPFGCCRMSRKPDDAFTKPTARPTSPVQGAYPLDVKNHCRRPSSSLRHVVRPVYHRS